METFFADFNPEHALLILSGTALLLLGWMLYDAVITFVGSILGMAFGVAIAFLAHELVQFDDPWKYVILGVGAVVGLIGGVLLFRFLNKAAFFWMGSLLGGLFVWAIFDATDSFHSAATLAAPMKIGLKVLLAFTIGLLCLWMRKTFVIIMTAMAGSILIREGFGWMPGNGFTLLSFPVGLILQWNWSRKKRDLDQ